MSSNEFVFRDETGATTGRVSLEFVRQRLADVLRAWESGSGDCGLTRMMDGATLALVVRPALGVLLTYEEESVAPQIVFAPSGSDETELALMRVGGDEIRVPRAWFVPLADGLRVVEQFMSGERFTEGTEWTEYLVNP
jgi:hypothetical protein